MVGDGGLGLLPNAKQRWRGHEASGHREARGDAYARVRVSKCNGWY